MADSRVGEENVQDFWSRKFEAGPARRKSHLGRRRVGGEKPKLNVLTPRDPNQMPIISGFSFLKKYETNKWTEPFSSQDKFSIKDNMENIEEHRGLKWNEPFSSQDNFPNKDNMEKIKEHRFLKWNEPFSSQDNFSNKDNMEKIEEHRGLKWNEPFMDEFSNRGNMEEINVETHEVPETPEDAEVSILNNSFIDDKSILQVLNLSSSSDEKLACLTFADKTVFSSPADTSDFLTCHDVTTASRFHNSFYLKTPGKQPTLRQFSDSPFDPLEGICDDEDALSNTPKPTKDEIEHSNNKPEAKYQMEPENNQKEVSNLPQITSNSKATFQKNQRLELAPVSDDNFIYVNDKRYTRLTMLGKGGSSQVFKVLDEQHNTVAIKCVNLGNVEEVIANGYLNEIQLLAKLQDCETVIRMFDYEYIPETKKLNVVMEIGEIDFSKLLKNVEETKNISHAMVIYYWSEMVAAVKEIHERGIIHSDLKPANFLVVRGRLKLIDFGISSSLQGDMTSVFKEITTGTFNYMSPEAISYSGDVSGYKISYKSDIWSLGCILFNLLYGHTPFSHIRNTIGKLRAIADPNSKISFPPDKATPIHLIIAMRLCFLRDPKLRPTASDLIKILELPFSNHTSITRQMDILACQELKHAFPNMSGEIQLLEDEIKQKR